MSHVAPASEDKESNQRESTLPHSIHVPEIKGEMLLLRPARLEDLEVLDQIETFYGASTITGSAGDTEREVISAWVRDSVAWTLGDVDVEAAFSAKGRSRTMAWTMLSQTQNGETEDEYRPIGLIVLTGIDAWSRSARIQVILGRDFRGRGYSRDAMPRVMTYGFASKPTGLGLHRIWVEVPEKNTRAISVYQSLGFSIEGTLRHALWDEENTKYQDQVILGTLADEYDPVRALDTFGMKMNPDNPGVKEALSAHEHSIEIEQDPELGANVNATVAPETEAETTGEQWTFPDQHSETAAGGEGSSKRAWWRRHGRSRNRAAKDANELESEIETQEK